MAETLSEAEEAWLDFEVKYLGIPRTVLRIAVGSRDFISRSLQENYWGFDTTPGSGFLIVKGRAARSLKDAATRWFTSVSLPGVAHVPSDNRTLTIPHTEFKPVSVYPKHGRFVYHFQPAVTWEQSLESWLINLRWEDLNAKEEGKIITLSRFATYADVFRQFTGNAKMLVFENGELVVRIVDGPAHSLLALSSGERQVLLLLAEILQHWKPGSLILIDEPELHLHTQWQGRLYDAIRYWQCERGGQVVLATQSGDLVNFADAGTVALLGRDG